MLLLSALVLGLVLFMIVYARYMNACGNLTDRRLRVDNYREQVEQRVNKLNEGTKKVELEIEVAKRRIERLERAVSRTRLN